MLGRKVEEENSTAWLCIAWPRQFFLLLSAYYPSALSAFSAVEFLVDPLLHSPDYKPHSHCPSYLSFPPAPSALFARRHLSIFLHLFQCLSRLFPCSPHSSSFVLLSVTKSNKNLLEKRRLFSHVPTTSSSSFPLCMVSREPSNHFNCYLLRMLFHVHL